MAAAITGSELVDKDWGWLTDSLLGQAFRRDSYFGVVCKGIEGLASGGGVPTVTGRGAGMVVRESVRQQFMDEVVREMVCATPTYIIVLGGPDSEVAMSCRQE